MDRQSHCQSHCQSLCQSRRPAPCAASWSRALGGVLLAALLTLGPTALAHDQVPAPEASGPVLLRGGVLYTVSGEVLEGADLLMEGGKIVALGEALAVPSGAEVIELEGARVYPGLIAPQTTLGLVEIGAVRATTDMNEAGEISPEAEAHVAYNPDSEILPTIRAHGVTTVQVAPQGELIAGRPMVVHLDGWTKEDAALKLAHGLQVVWPEVRDRRRRFGPPTRPEEQKKERQARRRELRRAFERALAQGASEEGASDPGTQAMVPALAGDEPIFIVANDARQIEEADELSQEMGFRPVIVGGRQADQYADLLAAHDVPVILGPITALPVRPDDPYDLPFRLPSILEKAGVLYCLALPGGSWNIRNLPFQAGQAVAFGLDEEAALRALTLSAAKILGIDERQGSLEVGKDATLFVSKGDVLDTIGQKVTHVFIEGRPVDLDNRHRELYRKYEQKPDAPAFPRAF